MGRSEIFYRFVVDKMLNGFAYSHIIKDENNKPIDYELIEVNPAFEELTGYRGSQIVNRSFISLFPKQRDFINTWINRLQQAAESGGQDAFEYYWAPLDKWYYITVYNVEPNFFITIFSDITRLKQTEAIAEEQRKNFSTFFNSIDAFLFVLEDDGRIKYVNHTMLNGLGYSREELINKDVLLLHPPELQEEARRIFLAMTRGEQRYCAIPLQHKNGRQIPVESRIIKGYWSGEEVFFAVSKDISNLALSEKKFSYAFYLNPTLMSISSLEDGYYLDVNESYCEKLEYKREELVGHSSVKLGIFMNTNARELAKEIIIKEGKLVNHKIIFRTKSGKELIGLTSANQINIGGKDYLLTMINDITELEEMHTNLQKKNHQLEKLNRLLVTQAVTDELTGLYNRRYIVTSLEREIERAERYLQPLTVMMLDLDRFKKVNDSYGHPVGDQVLVTAAAIIRSNIRKIDIAGRFGGEEFMVILPQTNLSDSTVVAERIRQEIEQCPFTSKDIHVTISIGICEYAGEDMNQLVSRADELLYLAKNNGRNRIETATASVLP